MKYGSGVEGTSIIIIFIIYIYLTEKFREFYFTTGSQDQFYFTKGSQDQFYFTKGSQDQFYFTKGSQDQFCLQNIQSAGNALSNILNFTKK